MFTPLQFFSIHARCFCTSSLPAVFIIFITFAYIFMIYICSLYLYGTVVMYLDFHPSVPGSIPGVDGKNE